MRGRRVLVALAAVNAVLIAALGFSIGRARTAEWHGTLLDPPMVTEPFELVSADGPVTTNDLRGRWTILFFGYTRCPDACPLTLEKLRRVHDQLGDDAEHVQVTLVSVDPGHDTPAVIADYVTRFDPSFLGLTGDAATLEAVAKAYGIHHAERPRDDGGPGAHPGHATEPVEPAGGVSPHADATAPRAEDSQSSGHAVPATLIDHTTHVLVLDRDGRLAMLWGPEITAEQMTSDLRRLLRR